ncbi:glycosyl hydrolase [Aquirufa sp. Wall-65K1]
MVKPRNFLLLLSLFLLSWGSIAQDAMKSEFMTPPNSAKPRVWWHWMNGNISKEGIQKDLEWMEKTGIGGFQNFDASLMTPVIVKEKLSFMNPAWKDAFKFTADLAKKKNLEMAIAGSPGWSVTGGPWVKPSDAMKKYVWSETRISGGKLFSGKIPAPSSVTGPMQNTPVETGGFGGPAPEPAPAVPEYYQDFAVIAYPVPSKDKAWESMNATITSSGGNFSLAQLNDGDLHNFSLLPPKKVGEETWIQYEFPEAQEIAAVTIANEGYGELAVFRGGPENRFLQYSMDGINFKQILAIPGTITAQTTLSFSPIKAKFIRLVYQVLAPEPGFMAAFGASPDMTPKGTKVSEFRVHVSPKVHLFEGKAGFQAWVESPGPMSYNPSGPTTQQVIDLTSQMKSDGSLSWNAPAGEWLIYRFGYSLTGKKNHPASPEATGLEVDKIDKEAVSRYLNNYLDQYKDATGADLMGKQGLTHMVLDSYEAGHMTWTPAMMEVFKSKRGYDMKPWLPVLVGQIVQDLTSSEKFLWDFRKTIGEMIVENHYELIGEVLAQRGMKRYTESHETGRIFLADGMDVKRKSDIPMSAMWQPGALVPGADEEIRSRADIRESASVAHIYGQNIVAAESMTTVGNPFKPHPGTLKRTADVEMASGLNRFVIHTSVHQPLDNLFPGFTLGPFGQWFTRQETWADQAHVWGEYLGRSSYMLQQGKFVADILYYYGENTNITSNFTKSLPEIPAGYEYDFVNATALKSVISSSNRKLVNPQGGQYSLLVLDPTAQQMTLSVLKSILKFAQAGVPIAGQAPAYSPSLADNEQEFTSLLAQLKKLPNVHFGKNLKQILAQIQVAEDVQISNQKAEILYVHRSLADKEIYWLNSRSDQANSAQISFRVSGKVPAIWNPETGEISKVGYEIKGGRTLLNLEFSPWDAYFVVFDEKAKALKMGYPKPQVVKTQGIEGPWKVQFQKDRSAPAEITLNSLISWNKHENEGVKYFSGVATYSNKYELLSIARGESIKLDLGDVKNLAEVYVNGTKVSTLWKKPYVVDITSPLKMGKNTIEIKVINSWVNRLVGDAQPGANKITFTSFPLIRPNSQTEESGLLGPVKVLIYK